MKKDLSQVIQKDSQMGAIYISSLASAQSLKLLQQHNIKSVLSVARDVKLTQVSSSLLDYLVIPAYDHPLFDLSQFFDSTFTFIEKGRKVGNVLVHCVAGISRSATIVAAYLIRKYQMTAKRSIFLIQKQRAQIQPNPGFMKQLLRFEGQILLRPKRNPFMDIKQEKSSFSTIRNILKNNSSEISKRITTQPYACDLVESQLITSVERDSKQKEVSRRYSDFGEKKGSLSKTMAKIQKVKKEMVNRLKDPSSRVKTQFSELLQSNIYKNKLRLLR